METLNEKQTLILENRKTLIIDGIKNVESFNDDFVELTSVMGNISVEGSALKIESLDQQTGKIYIVGEINGFYYTDTKRVKSFWSKFFK